MIILLGTRQSWVEDHVARGHVGLDEDIGSDPPQAEVN
jgi:hypothetical protein